MARTPHVLTKEQRKALTALARARQNFDRAAKQLDDAAAHAASLHTPWREIGPAMRMTPQAAHYRYGGGKWLGHVLRQVPLQESGTR